MVFLLGLPRRDLHQYRYVLGCVGKAAPSTDVHLGDVVSSMHDFDDDSDDDDDDDDFYDADDDDDDDACICSSA